MHSMCICQLFLHPTSKHQTWISSMVSLHSVHSAIDNEKNSPKLKWSLLSNWNEECIVTKIGTQRSYLQ
jgi:hypothetical protein